MKKYLSLLLLLACVVGSYAQDPAYPVAPAAPSNIRAAESFIDTDPGVGKGTIISITAATDIANAPALINTTGLSNGVRRLYIRTLNTEGSWSITQTRDFLLDANPVYTVAPAAPQNIIAAEYFFDTDPGFGSGTPVTIAAGVDINNTAITLNTTSLGNGAHRLYLRTKNAEGRWSLVQMKEFNVDFDFQYPAAPAAAQNIIAAEYFFDTDPGFGNGLPVSITAGTDLNSIAATLATAALSLGTHRLYFRTKNQEGRWSVTMVREFITDNDFNYPAAPAIVQNVIAAEYFIDSDPGFGNGSAIPVAQGIDINNLTVAAATNALSTGIHHLYIRSKNQEGRWAITAAKDFVVNNDITYPTAPPAVQNITAAEYFIDTDPGFGAGTGITIAAGTDLSTIAAAVNTTGLSNGTHRLFVRTRNQEGRWSITASDTFATSLIRLSADTLLYNNIPANTVAAKNLVVTNSSNTSQTISTAFTHAPFTTDFAGNVTLAPGQSVTIAVSFSPLSAGNYADSLVLATSAGSFSAILRGSAIVSVASWTLDPASGYNFGNIALNTTANTGFAIRNTGNIDIVLSMVLIGDPAFTPSFTAGAVVPVNGSINLPVSFTPAAVGQYAGQLSIKSSTVGVGDVTSSVSGNGYSPGTPPVLEFISAAPFSGVTGVQPAAGQAGLFTYKVLYKSANNLAPRANYPQLGIDLNGDNDFNDLNEGIFNMVKDGSSTDYVNGVVYSYTFNHTSNTNTAGYQFFAKDANGNTAGNTAYRNGPVVTDQQLDLRIFANNISFSKTNPQPAEAFTVTATVSNSTAVPASNVPIKFYRDTILIGNGVIPAVNAFSSSTISFPLNFGAEGFFPIKVWIDSSNTLGESNILNNYAIRPVVVGSPALPGGITATTAASVQQCPQLTVLITGSAVYYGTGTTTRLAGAAVTINTGTQVINTTTDANGNYSYLFTGVSCGSAFTYTVSITDFTFTSALVTGSMAMPCPLPNACALPPAQGGVGAVFSTSSCSNVVGSNANVNFVVRYRSRDVSNMWGLFDEIANDKLEIFQDGVLTYSFTSPDGTHGPGEEITIPVNFPLSSTTPVTVTAKLSYTYVEYKQIPSSIYHGERTNLVATGGGTITPVPNKPDLTIQQVKQTAFTAFDFDDANIKCTNAGSHTVKIFDAFNGGASVLVKTTTIASLAAQHSVNISFSDPSLLPGSHVITIVTDSEGTVTEDNEGNNEFVFTMVVPEPDLTISVLKATPTAAPVGTVVHFSATVKNTGIQTGSFTVRFTVNGVQVGALKTVATVPEKGAVTVLSDAFVSNTPEEACGAVVEAVADAGSTVAESAEGNNTRQMLFAPDLAPFQLPAEQGSAGNPVVVRVNTSNQFFPAIRNTGERDARTVTVKYTLNGTEIGKGELAVVRAGEVFASFGSFTHTFTAPGNFIVKVTADTAGVYCEPKGNNEGSFFIRVVDSKPDFEVLSQFISPSSLNPNAAQNISIVGTVRNTGGKPTTANVLRFLVDDIQLGADVPINALQPGRDTTVAATAPYASAIAGVKVVKIVADPAGVLDEEREDNNEATRALIVGDAPDMARSQAGAISFNPGGFSAGDSVLVLYSIKNNGVQAGAAFVRFMIYDELGALTAVEDVPFALAAGAAATISKKMKFDVTRGTVIARIFNCSPAETDLLNNEDTLAFSTVAKLKSNTSISGNLDMKAAAPAMLPGWIGGKLVLGDYDLVVNGSIINFDTAHFVVTDGAGRLKLVNGNAVNLFPVGASLYSPGFVNINNGGTPDNFSVAVVPYVLQNGSSGDTVKAGYVNRTWLIDEQVPGGSNAILNFSWNILDEQGGFNRAQSRTAHYTGSWQLGDLGAATADSAGWYSRQQSGYTSFSPFTVTSVNVALPLHLLQFTAVASGKAALLQWQTADEVNTSHFVIQHSVTGQQFADIGSVNAVNRVGTNQYSFTHTPLAEGLHYYRLRMTDMDGRFTYSGIKLVKIEAGTGLQVYPNPAGRFVTVNGMATGGIIRLLTVDGKLLKQLPVTGSTMLVDLSGLAGGMYILTYSHHGQTVQRPLVKE
jgi:CARDB